MSDPFELLRVLLLLGVANGAPIFARRLLGERLAAPIDRGAHCPDGRPLLGRAKTIRGVVAALVATAAIAPLLGLSWQIGLALAAASMGGDLLSSFTKRRAGMAVHAQSFGLDQVPEALLPLLLLRGVLGLNWLDVAALLLAFVVLEVALSRLLFRLGIRQHPY